MCDAAENFVTFVFAAALSILKLSIHPSLTNIIDGFKKY